MEIRKKILFLSLLSCYGLVQATPITLTGSFIKTGVNDVGTLGSGFSTSPGLLFDPTGTGNYASNNDYLTPGTPYDYFGVRSNQTGLVGNSNSFSSNPITTVSGPTNISGSTLSASWSGTFDKFFNITNTYTFNDTSQRINVSTSITALQDLTNLQFARSIDPDPDVNTFGIFNTINSLGNTGLGIPTTDLAYALGAKTGLPLGLFTNSTFEHNAGIIADWGGPSSSAADPTAILAGINNGDGDYALGLGFNLGDILAGRTISFDYDYVLGLDKGSIDVPPSSVPLPASLPLMSSALGLFGFGAMRRRNKS